MTDVPLVALRNVVIAPAPVRLTLVPVGIVGPTQEWDFVLSSGGEVPHVVLLDGGEPEGWIGRPWQPETP